jgi:hypothetical protein
MSPSFRASPERPNGSKTRVTSTRNGDGQFGLCLMNPLPYPESKGKYRNAQKRLLAAGFIQSQDGDSEGTFLFDPTNAIQSKLAIREAGIKVRRQLTPERLQAMQAHGAMLAQNRWRDKQEPA